MRTLVRVVVRWDGKGGVFILYVYKKNKEYYNCYPIITKENEKENTETPLNKAWPVPVDPFEAPKRPKPLCLSPSLSVQQNTQVKKLLTQFIKYQSPEATHVCCRFAFVRCCICLFFCVLDFNSAGLSLYRFPPLHLTSFVKLYHTHMLCFESKTFFALCVVFIFFFQRLFIYFFHFQIFDCVRYGI